MHLPPTLITIARLIANLALVMAIFVPLERLFAARRQKVLRAAFWTDLGYFMLNGLVPQLLLILPLSLLAWALHHAIPGGYYARIGHLNLGVRLAGALVVGEIGYYWGHRWMHEIPLLWRFHAIHHRAEEMDFLINTRGHPIDIVFGRLCGLVPMYVLGLAQPMGHRLDLVPLLFAVIGNMWGYFVHANVNWRFGWLEYLVATPGFHHWHHTNDGPDVIDKNYASMLPWVDWMFGTIHLPKTLPQRYGVSTPIPEGLGAQLIYPLQPAPAPVRAGLSR